MSKILLIAQREYLAFVRTVGFWLSLFVLPVLIVAIGAVPLLLASSAPVKHVNVAVIDLSGRGLEADLRAIVRDQQTKTEPSLRDLNGHDEIRLVDTPAAMAELKTVDDANQRLPGLLDSATSAVVVAHDHDGVLAFDIWSVNSQKDVLRDAIEGRLNDLQAYRLAAEHGVDAQVARDIRRARADVTTLTPAIVASHGENDAMAIIRDKGPTLIGAAMGYLSWMAIFSSSMILLGGVIEEKASKVLEVLLASAPTEALLIGKVLGVAAVMLTVAAIWAGTAMLAGTYGLSAVPADKLPVLHAFEASLAALFTPGHVALLLCYFVGGYLMFGVTFSAIGAFCETQKDAQAIMGPVMIVLMIPMLTMQAAFIAPDSPVLRYASWVPIFSPFLMPLRLAGSVPWYEVAGTLAGMAVVGFFMIQLGRRAFRQGALTGGKLTWGTVFRIATRKAAS